MAKKSFEYNMDRVKEIADALESGAATLDESLKLYKEAVKILIALKGELDSAKGEVYIMQKGLESVFAEEEADNDEF